MQIRAARPVADGTGSCRSASELNSIRRVVLWIVNRPSLAHRVKSRSSLHGDGGDDASSTWVGVIRSHRLARLARLERNNNIKRRPVKSLYDLWNSSRVATVVSYIRASAREKKSSMPPKISSRRFLPLLAWSLAFPEIEDTWKERTNFNNVNLKLDL